MASLIPVDKLRKSYLGEEALNSSFSRGSQKITGSANFILKECRNFIAQDPSCKDRKDFSEAQISQLVESIEELHGEQLSSQERNTVILTLSQSLEDFSVLNSLVQDPDINDIIVRSYNEISVQKGRKNFRTDLAFPCHESYQAFIENLLKRAGKSCTSSTPVVDTAIDSRVRACVTHQSFSPPGMGPMLTLRIARHSEVTLRGLEYFEFAPNEILKYLEYLVAHSGKTILIAGEVGTGKTTLVRALSQAIPETESILLIEDTQEINLCRPFARTLLTRGNNSEGTGEIPPWLAIRTGMRMAMNRIILGEMRDAAAAEAFIDVASSGHPGLSTIHARSSKDALGRLEIFLLRAQANAQIETIRRQICNAVSVIVFLGMDRKSGRRKIKEVIEVGQSAEGCIQSSAIYSFQDDQNTWKRERGISQFDQQLRRQEIVLSSPGSNINLSLKQTAA